MRLGKRSTCSHAKMRSFQELVDEAFADLLKKNDRPVDLKDALRRSAGHNATVHELRPTKKGARIAIEHEARVYASAQVASPENPAHFG
jgi:hypothetical protein